MFMVFYVPLEKIPSNTKVPNEVHLWDKAATGSAAFP
jgi:hypothetical protein